MKRKNLLVAFTTFAVALVASAFGCLNFTKASAESTQITISDTITMQEGASVRVKSNDVGGTGIRFRLYIDAETFNPATDTVGMYLTETANLTEGLTLDNEDDVVALGNKVKMVTFNPANDHTAVTEIVEENLTFSKSVYVFNAVKEISNTELYGEQYTANGFIKSGESATVFKDAQTRTVAGVASYALEDSTLDEDAKTVLNNYVDGVLGDENFKFESATISTDMYKETPLSQTLVKPEIGLNVTYTSSAPEVVAVENGELARKGLGTAEITAKIGSKTATATVTITEPKVLIVDEDNFKNIKNKDIPMTTCINSEAEEVKDFAGSYTGNATRIDWATNQNYVFDNPYTLQELATLKANYYNQVTIWFATSEVLTGESIRFYYEGHTNMPANFFDKAGWGTKHIVESSAQNGTTDMACKTWYPLTITMDDYIALATATDGTTNEQISLLGSWAYVTGDKYSLTNTAYFYFGNIEIQKIAPELVSIKDGASAKSFAYDVPGNYAGYGAYTTASELGFAGDYNGNVASLTYYNSKIFKFKNTYTATTIEQVAKHYNTVSIWVAFKDTDTATTPATINVLSVKSSIANEATFAYYLNNGKAALKLKEWIKLSISIEDFKTCLEKNEYAEWCQLFYGGWHDRGNGSSTLYFGDMFFENT